jgi:hypothetical protein
LLGRLADVDRLVLLGDLLELRHGPLRDALAVATPALREIAGALPAGAEVVLVAGNHDHHLVAPWLERRARSRKSSPLGLESEVDWRENEPLGAIAAALSRVTVRAAYPGVWLRDDIYATHGHYADRHTTVPMLERLSAGFTARVAGEPPEGPRRAEDYERVLAPTYAWIHALAQYGGVALRGGSQSPSTRAWAAMSAGNGRRSVHGLGLRLALPVAVAALNRGRVGPLRAEISGVELRRAGLSAFGQVVQCLGISARHVVFGHTHRAGPLPGDETGEWASPNGARLLNTGSWLLEPIFLGAAPQTSPYRPGFAAIVEPDAAPRLLNMLDGVSRPAPA